MATLVWFAARHLHIDLVWPLQGAAAAAALCAWKAVFDRLAHPDASAAEALLGEIDRLGW